MADPAPTNQKVVFILDHPDDIGEYQKTGSSFEGVHTIIATSPDVCWELEKRGMLFRSIEDYWDPAEIYSLGMDNYRTLDQLCTGIDVILKDNSSLLKKYDLNPALDNFHYLKILYDGITFRIAFVQTIIETETPDILVAYRPRNEEKTGWNFYDLPFDSSDNLYALVLSMKGWTCPTRVLDYDLAKKPPRCRDTPQSFLLRVKKGVTNFPLLFIPLFSLKNLGLTKTIKMIFYQYRNYFLKSTSLLLLRQEPSWSSLIFQIYQKGYQAVYLPGQIEQETSVAPLDPEIGKIIRERIGSFASYRDIDYSDIFSHHMSLTISTYIAAVPKIVETTESIINSSNPAVFLCSEKSSIVEHIYAHIGKFHHIPVLAWQHGDGPFYPPMQVYVEIMNSDVHLSYGPGHQRMLSAAPHNHFNCTIESVGSFQLEMLRSGKQKMGDKQTILYVTSPFYYNTMYFSAYPVLDNERWSQQKDILMTLGHLPFDSIFKISAGQKRPRFIDEYIVKNHLDSITVIRNERTFTEILKDVDIVICDAPETPVIEAIAAGKTVFVLLSSQFLREEALVLLKKRVYWSDNVNDFVRLIQDVLSGVPVDQHPDINNTEYLEACGLHKLDGKVSERALAIIERETHSLKK
jgi:hypothetical protein